MIFVVVISSIVKICFCFTSSDPDIFIFDSSSVSKEGYFSSPEYPYSFQNKMNRVYRFYGLNNERVQIVFDDFSLRKPNPNEICNKGNSYLSYRNDEGEVVYLCGPERPLPILSDSNKLFLEYRQPLVRTPKDREDEMKGFNATYRFVTNFGIDSGNQTSERCNFIYSSENAKNGSFQSPNFNGFYPKNFDCVYYFRGSETYLKINFTHFNLVGSTRCIINEDDVVELMGAVDRDPAYYYERICGPQDTFNRTVNGNNFFIVFTSYEGHVDDSKITMDRQFVGFHALYEFTNNTVSNAKRTTASESNLPFLLTYLVVKLSFFLSVISST